LTEYEAQRLLDYSPDLQHTLGRGGKNSQQLARDHYLDFGYQNTELNKAIEMPSWDKLFNCGTSEHGEQTSSCKCGGVFHLGLANNPITGAEMDTFDKMRQFKTFEKRTYKGKWSECLPETFGLPHDFLHEHDVAMQCWCERKPRNVPTLCANYGGDCLCNGLVF
jgi:hypothetical protein